MTDNDSILAPPLKLYELQIGDLVIALDSATTEYKKKRFLTGFLMIVDTYDCMDPFVSILIFDAFEFKAIDIGRAVLEEYIFYRIN